MKKLIAGNWKMNGGLAANEALVKAMLDGLQGAVPAADMVLCAPVLEAEARAQNKDLRAHYVHMIVHGTLHAIGYDHERSAHEAKRMEGLEILILQGLGQNNPYEA